MFFPIDQFCKNQLKVSDVEYWYYLYIKEKIPDIQSAFNDFWSPSLNHGGLGVEGEIQGKNVNLERESNTGPQYKDSIIIRQTAS